MTQFTHNGETFEINEGDEVCIMPEFDTEETRPLNTTTGIVRFVKDDRVGVKWFGVGGPIVYTYFPFELSQVGTSADRPGVVSS